MHVIIIDSNALARLSLYVESCNAVDKPLDINIETLKDEFQQKSIDKEYLNMKQIQEGYKLFTYIKGSRNVISYLSRFSEIELLGIFLDRAFDEELTRKGIPYRIRRKKPFRIQIDFDYQERIVDYWNRIKQILKDYSIEFNYIEDEGDAIYRIMQISNLISKYVALESIDLYLYSAAIYLRANELYTHDKELKSIINNINNNSSWDRIKNGIISDLKNQFNEFKEEFERENNITLPSGVP